MIKQKDTSDNLRKKWSFHWGLMDVLIGGKSPIDLKKLGIKDTSVAERFVESYGYDLKNLEDRRFIHCTIVEALSFVEKVLMPREWGQGKSPPQEIIESDNVVQLLQWASMGREDGKKGLLSVWSCAILRVVHTIAHIHGVQRNADIDQARNQIIARFREFLFRSEKGLLLLGSPKNHVELEKIDWKSDKARVSVILKLLHKPANVAETIYDFVGIRIVTKTYADVMQAVKILGEQFLISFPNANPKRARNSLIDLEDFREKITMLKQKLDHGELEAEDFVDEVAKIKASSKETKKRVNPHSSNNYKSIQMTCRQLVKYDDPAMLWLTKLSNFLDQSSDEINEKTVLRQTEGFVKTWFESIGLKRKLKVFFPFEVQVFDRETLQNIEMSEANHILYKKAQVRTARKRVLSDVLKFYKLT